jgi:hypothetical protein
MPGCLYLFVCICIHIYLYNLPYNNPRVSNWKYEFILFLYECMCMNMMYFHMCLKYAWMHIYVLIHVCWYLNTYMNIEIYEYRYIYRCVSICIKVCMDVYIYACIRDDDDVYLEYYSGKGFHINYSCLHVLRKTHKLVQ